MVQGTQPQQGVQMGWIKIPLILNNNNPDGVTDEVREITWFYTQR